MGPSETFVVRIYRRGQADGTPLVGTVELVASGRTLRFASFEELRAILEVRPSGGTSGRQSGRTRKPKRSGARPPPGERT
jgi:hypothetical protein